jgi:BatD DUF11 like domain
MALLLCPASAMGAQLVATVDHNTIGKNDMILLSVRLTGGDGDFQLDTSPLDKDFYVIPKGSGRKTGEWREKRFQLGPKHTGVLTIPSLEASWDDQTLTSQPFQVTVQNQTGSIDDARLWIETHVDRTSSWQRQQLVYRFTVFSTNPVVAPQLAPPDFSGFEVNAVEENTPGERIIDGRRVQTENYVYVLFPKQTGELTIPGPVVKATLVQTVKSWRVAAGQASIDDEKHLFLAKTAVGSTQNLHVRPLPAAATSLPVGMLSVHSGISEAQAIAGAPLTWTVKVQGSGVSSDYLPDMQPLMKLAGSFKIYSETPDISLVKRQSGMTTTAIWRQVMLPQKAGAISLPAIKISYFNPQDGRIEQAATPAVNLTVAPPQQDQGDVVFQAGPSMLGHGVSLVRNTSRWWKWVAMIVSLLWLLTLALWLLPGRSFGAWLRNRKMRKASFRQVLSARDAFEQFTRLKVMLGLPARLSPLGFLDICPQLKDTQVGPWLEHLEHGRYAEGEPPLPLDDRTIRQIRVIVERRNAVTPTYFSPKAFGRIGAGSR